MKWNYRKAERDFLRRYLVRVLRASNLRVIPAAELAQVNRTHFYDLLKRARVSPGKIAPRSVYTVRPYRTELDAFSRRFLSRVLAKAGYSPSRAADLLGVDRTHVYRMAARLGVGLRRLREKFEGNRAWLALEDPEPDTISRPARPLDRAEKERRSEPRRE